MTSRSSTIWFGCGIAALGGVIGLLIGASRSPVAGVAATAAFGLLATAFTWLQQVRQSTDPPNPMLVKIPQVDIGAVGQVLVLFAVSFLVGVVGGAQIRVSAWPSPDGGAVELPWHGKTSPKGMTEALAWVEVQHRLTQKGLSSEAVRHLYEMSQKYPALTAAQLLDAVPELGETPARFELGRSGIIAEESKLAEKLREGQM